jgi:hypothetical protein
MDWVWKYTVGSFLFGFLNAKFGDMLRASLGGLFKIRGELK